LQLEAEHHVGQFGLAVGTERLVGASVPVQVVEVDLADLV